MSREEFTHLPEGAPARIAAIGESSIPRIASAQLLTLLNEHPSYHARLFGHLSDGLLRSYAAKAYFATTLSPDEERAWKSPIQVISAARHGSDSALGPFNQATVIDPYFWQPEHIKNACKWEGVTFFGQSAVFANWLEGRFEAILWSAEEFDYGGGQVGRERITLARFYGVTFSAEDVTTLFPLPLEQKTVRARASKHNWEAAMAAFGAAQWKHDIVPDVYAYGAQAKIEDWFADWFAALGETPAEGTIRGRARMILEAMQKADKS